VRDLFSGVCQPTFFQLIAKDVLGGGGEVLDLIGEFLDFDVAHFAVKH